MATESLQIDPLTEDAANAAFDLWDSANGVDVTEQDWAAPDTDPMTAGSADTEGDPYIQSRYRNRQITVKVKLSKSTAAALDTVAGQLQQKVAKLKREGGTLKRTTAGGNVLVADILDADIDVPADWQYIQQNVAIVTLTFVAMPGLRGTEQTLGAFSGTGDVQTVYTGVKGDLYARGRVLIIEGGTADKWYAQWGIRSRYYSAGTTSNLAFEAEALLPQGGAVGTALSGASGGSAIYQGTLTTSYQSMLSTAKAAGTVYGQHVGDYSFWARLYRPTTNAGTVSVCLEYADSDFGNPTRNVSVAYDADEREGDFTLANLGQVHLAKVKKGSQRWEGRILAKSTTTGDDLYVDRVWLQPINESAGEVTASLRSAAITSYTGRDDFSNLGAGTALNGGTAAVGGTWATSGATTDFIGATGGGD